MILLNIGCELVRPGDPWINVDVEPRAPAHNFVQWDLTHTPWPWEDNSVDGILASHVFEHFDAIQLQKVVGQCYRVLKPDGALRISVPDASYFRQVHAHDSRAHAADIFGEPLQHPFYETFMGWALFLHNGHYQVFTEDSMWCTLVNREYEGVRTGESFLPQNIVRVAPWHTSRPTHYSSPMLAYMDNRPKFSLFMEAFK